MLYFIYLQTPFTHGEDGIQGIPQGTLFGFINLSNPTILYYVVLAGFLVGFLLIFRTINSPFGEVLKSIRENEPRAISLGYKTDQYKLLAFILSGTLGGFLEPAFSFGITGALLSGKISAMAVTEPVKAEKEFKRFTGGIPAHIARKREPGYVPTHELGDIWFDIK